MLIASWMGSDEVVRDILVWGFLGNVFTNLHLPLYKAVFSAADISSGLFLRGGGVGIVTAEIGFTGRGGSFCW